MKQRMALGAFEAATPLRGTGLAVSVLTLALAIYLAPVPVVAQATTTQQQTQAFDVPAGALSSALLRFGEQSGLQFNIDSKLTDGKRSQGVRGRYSLDGALNALLSGSGLIFRFSGPRTVVIEAQPEVGDAHLLGALRIGGSVGGGGGGGTGSPINGSNGSGDVTSTEGSGSFTSGALSIASKMPLSMKDTAQSVSVITHQRIIEQNLTDFDTLLEYAPGIVAITPSGGPLKNEYYSRGFRIQRVQIDGGAPLDIEDSNFGMSPLFDMSIYDHAEILRGADGLFNGFGNAGGVVSLQRKRPLDHFQLVMEGQAGSWDNYRTMLDVSGPLALNGRLRGRAVAVWNDHDYFYSVASNRREVLFGTLDFDLTPTTLLSLGYTRTLQESVPATGGLPRYESGQDIGFSRDTCLCAPWGRYTADSSELFVRAEQLIGESWKLSANVTYLDQSISQKFGSVSGTVNPVDLTGSTMSSTREFNSSEQLTADMVLNGAFQWLGHTQHLVVTASTFEADGPGYSTFVNNDATSAAVDVLNFDPYDPAYYDQTDTALLSNYYPTYKKAQRAIAANLRLTFWEPLHLELGFKYNHVKQETVRQGWCTRTACTTNVGVPITAGEMIGVFTSGYTDEEISWPPPVKLIYDINDNLSSYVSYTDIYQEQTTQIDFNGDVVDPVTGSNYEAGLKWSARDGKLNASLGVYRIEEKNHAIWVGSSSQFPSGLTNILCCYSSDSDYTKLSKGVDLEVTGELLPGWQIGASYHWNDNVEEGEDAYSEGEALQTRFPKHLMKLWSTYRFQSGEWLRRLALSGGFNAQSRAYYSGRVCPEYNETGCARSRIPFEFEQGSYLVADVRAAYQLSDRWQISLNVNNVLDRRYWKTVSNTVGGNWYGEPRNYTLTVRGQF